MPFIEIGFMLPFFFILAIVYGALEVSKTFQNRGVKIIISVVIAFFAATSAGVAELLVSVLPYAAIFFVAFFFLNFVLSALKDKGKKDYPLLLVVLALAIIFLSNQDFLGIINIQDQNFIGMVVLLIIVVIVYSAAKIKD